MLPPADRYPMPSIVRTIVGLILAGSVPGALVALLGLLGGGGVNALGFGAFLGIFYGLPPALILGLPAVYLLRRVFRPTLIASVVTGSIVASILAILAALSISPGLLALVPLAAVPLGAIGGATFWFVALRHLKPLAE